MVESDATGIECSRRVLPVEFPAFAGTFLFGISGMSALSTSLMAHTIRRITPADDKAMGDVLQLVYDEIGSEGRVATYTLDSDPQVRLRVLNSSSDSSSATSAHDSPQLVSLSAHYADKDSQFFVVEVDGVIVGGGGFCLFDEKLRVCKMRKVALLPSVRGKGVGRALVRKLLEAMVEADYKICYLQTMHALKAAQKLYESFGLPLLPPYLFLRLYSITHSLSLRV